MTFERTEAQMKAQADMDQRRAEEEDAWRELSEWPGLPLICPAGSCRRAGRCAGRPSAKTHGLQPCLKHYREEVRFPLYGPDGLTEQLAERGPVADAASAPRRGLTLIEAIYGTGREALNRLRRPKGVRGPGAWSNDPEGFARYMAAGDWRNPGNLARPAPVNYYGRWVE
jgi:hypothetical protein